MLFYLALGQANVEPRHQDPTGLGICLRLASHTIAQAFGIPTWRIQIAKAIRMHIASQVLNIDAQRPGNLHPKPNHTLTRIYS